MITVKDILEAFLKANGFDGLYSPEGDTCACRMDDLMPCNGDWGGCGDCLPGYLLPGDDECPWKIGVPKKEADE